MIGVFFFIILLPPIYVFGVTYTAKNILITFIFVKFYFNSSVESSILFNQCFKESSCNLIRINIHSKETFPPKVAPVGVKLQVF